MLPTIIALTTVETFLQSCLSILIISKHISDACSHVEAKSYRPEKFAKQMEKFEDHYFFLVSGSFSASNAVLIFTNSS
jgi:hypothetical protein